MHISRLLPFLALVPFLASAQILPSAGRAPFRMLQSGQYSSARDQKMVVLSEQESFDRYWERELRQPPRTAPTNIDWFKYKVVAVHLGERPTGGYRIQMQGLDEDRSNQTTIRALEITPMPGSFVTQSITSPWMLLLVDNQLQNLKLSILKREGTTGVIGGLGTPNNLNGCGCNCPCCSGR